MSDPQLRVALCFGTFPPERNGGSDYVERYASALADRGIEALVLTSPAEGAPEREQARAGVEVRRMVDDWGWLSPARRRADAELADFGVQVLHVFFPDSVLEADYRLPARVGRGIPLVTTFWNLGLGARSAWSTRAEALALLLRSSVVTSHDGGYLAALQHGPGRFKPARWLPAGSNLDAPPPPEREEARARAGLDPEAEWLGFFGQLDPTRGVEDLFEALATLRQARDVRAVMIGSAGRPERYSDPTSAGYLTEMLALPGRLGIAESVVWTEFLSDEDVTVHLRALDLAVLPYRRNSLGRSALAAALELGVPTVLAGSAAYVAPLRDGVDVRLVPPRDPAALVAAVADLLDDPAARERLGAGAREASRFFTWPEIARRGEEIYRLALR